jgi:hypothetical protein
LTNDITIKGYIVFLFEDPRKFRGKRTLKADKDFVNYMCGSPYEVVGEEDPRYRYTQ